MKIDTQLDQQSEQDLLFIKQQTDITTTQIIRDLLATRAAEIRQKNKQTNKMKLFLKSDFIGCGEGVEDGSINYKNYITNTIDEKINYC